MIEILVGLEVTNDQQYTQYREAMTPILHSTGGSFGYDFKISEVLKSLTKNKINRVFTINFPSEEKMDSFFSDQKYLAIKEKFFVNAVASTTIISTYSRT
ncbi:MAG: DUF1330 domain-containing protein [Halobacteriovoraceae bacterium]|jgi:uncharacterized protein (DUF1330 family)|nr:DUF1330 domain-containing protein [Halobacteriovoraceae bacterium]MBT5093030.1 DUF1330 domain-containing protein [Halobacteriovoraceae bacterium]